MKPINELAGQEKPHYLKESIGEYVGLSHSSMRYLLLWLNGVAELVVWLNS